jgi:hypothetical protein
MILVKVAKASALGQVVEHWETLRAVTAGRNIPSTLLLVGSTSGCFRKRSRSFHWWYRRNIRSNFWLSWSFKGLPRKW